MKANLLILMIVLFFSGCTFPAWRDQLWRDILEDRWHPSAGTVGEGLGGSQTIEIYGRGGQHRGYARISGGALNIYRTDGTRARGW